MLYNNKSRNDLKLTHINFQFLKFLLLSLTVF